MSTIQVEAQLSYNELLKAVEQLSLPELEQFVPQIIALQARYRAPTLPKDEANLLLRINQGVPSNIQERYDELIAKRRAETLTPEEHSELLRLTEHIERLEAKRAEHMAELARLRNTSLTALMEELGIQPVYV